MDEVKARVKLAESAIESPLGVSLPRSEVERALQEEMDAELTLDVVRSNGSIEQQRLAVILDEATLRRLVEQEGEQVRVVIDPESLQAAFDDVEAHGLREGMATLAILVTAAAGGAGMAGAAVDQSAGTGAQSDPATFVAGVTDFPSIQATVVSGAPGAPGAFVAGVTDFPSAAAEEAITADAPGGPGDLRPAQAVEAGMPRAMPSDYAAAGVDTGAPTLTEGERAALVQQHRARIAADEASSPDIESIRAAQSTAPEADIESIRAAQRAPEPSDGGGISVDAPSAGVTAALAGGAALTIAAAAFALRRRREPEPAT